MGGRITARETPVEEVEQGQGKEEKGKEKQEGWGWVWLGGRIFIKTKVLSHSNYNYI